MTDQQPMQPVHGSVIVCDHLAQMAGGKWLIVGTYNRIVVPGDTWQGALAMFVRFQAERTGNHCVSVRVVVRDLASTAPPLARVEVEVRVDSPHVPFDCGIQAPLISLPCPVPYGELTPGAVVPLHLLVWVEVEGHALSTAPLELLFVKPTEVSTP